VTLSTTSSASSVKILLWVYQISPFWQGDGCTVPLNLKTFKNYSGQIWCSNCLILFARGSGVKGRKATPSAAKDSSQNSRSESTSRGNEHTDLLREVATLKEELHLQKQELRLQKQKLKRRMRKREDEMMRMIMGWLSSQYPWTDITSEEAKRILQEFGKETNLLGKGTFGRGNPPPINPHRFFHQRLTETNRYGTWGAPCLGPRKEKRELRHTSGYLEFGICLVLPLFSWACLSWK